MLPVISVFFVLPLLYPPEYSGIIVLASSPDINQHAVYACDVQGVCAICIHQVVCAKVLPTELQG